MKIEFTASQEVGSTYMMLKELKKYNSGHVNFRTVDTAARQVTKCEETQESLNHNSVLHTVGTVIKSDIKHYLQPRRPRTPSSVIVYI